ncbi:Uncharacterised protein [Collinsella intestinalis]|nr:Uncharacterised protein [Collinsella intestinalis]
MGQVKDFARSPRGSPACEDDGPSEHLVIEAVGCCERLARVADAGLLVATGLMGEGQACLVDRELVEAGWASGVPFRFGARHDGDVLASTGVEERVAHRIRTTAHGVQAPFTLLRGRDTRAFEECGDISLRGGAEDFAHGVGMAVPARVETAVRDIAAPVAGREDGEARLDVTFQDARARPGARRGDGSGKSARTAADDEDVVDGRAALRGGERRVAGCGYGGRAAHARRPHRVRRPRARGLPRRWRGPRAAGRRAARSRWSRRRRRRRARA